LDKPERIQDDNYLNNLYGSLGQSTENRKTLKMVQFTDLHVDLEYVEGSAIDCGNIICCREDGGFPTDPSNQAGPYGNYYCDIPPKLFHSMGDYIKSEVKPDVILWTGDIAPHD
jgi:sphingomyelin phosphodiesterase